MDRLTWAVVGGVLVLVASGLLIAALGRGRGTVPDLTSPSGVVVAYATAEQRGDGQTAWDLLAGSAQALGDRDHFLAAVANGGSPTSTYLSTEDEQVTGDSASVVLLRTQPGSVGLFGSSGYTSRVTVRLVREDGSWRISVPPDDYLLSKLSH
jgi:hypothetical protein